ncbi:MAG: lysine--tRNA ligase [Dehalococcoidia bacterium]
MPTEEELFAQRLAKREELARAGNPYPAVTARTHTASEAVAAFEAAEGSGQGAPVVTVAGRITALRRMGKTAFLDVRDGSGRVQVQGRADVLGEAFELLSLLDLGDFLEARGELFRTRTGEVTVSASEWRVLTKALRPLPEKWHGITDTEVRYRQRYLDLIANERSREIARIRADVVASIRRFFYERGFMEVDTPVLQEHAGGAAARPFVTHHNALDRDLFLRISLELHLKRLLIGGFDRVFELGRVFRNEGIDRRHNPEFTLLESYEAYADYLDVANMVEALLRRVAGDVGGSLQVQFGEHTVDLAAPFRRTTYRELLRDETGLDYVDHPDASSLRAAAAARGVRVEESASWGKVLDEVMSTLVEPKLIQPTFVFDYPAEFSPLAKRKADDPSIAERFELFAIGYELANAYSEQNDPVEQRERMREQASKQAGGDDEAEVADEDFLLALEYGMPPAGGLGIGVERLVMLMTGEASIREVILFPAMRERAGRDTGDDEAGDDEASDGGA